MKKVKKVLAMALATTVIASTTLLAGCGSSGNGGSSEKVTVDVFQFKVEAKDALEKAATEYEKNHENVTINIQTVGGGDDYGSALKAKFQSGEEPTIYNIGGPQDTLDWKEKLEDLTSADLTKQALDNTLGAVTKDGKVYGFPFALEGYGFIYNKDIFTKAGIDAAKIKTYADLEAAVKTLDSKKADLGLDSVFALPGKEKWVTGLHSSNLAFSNEFKDGTEAFNAKEISFKYADQLKKIIDIQLNYALMPDGTKASVNGVDYSTQVEKEFSLGKVAMIQQGNWVYGSVSGIDAKLSENIGILPIPVDGVKEDCLPVGVPMYWAVNSTKTDAEKTAAKDFLNWLYTSDAGKKMIIQDFKFIPAYKGYDSAELQPADPLAKTIAKYSSEGKTMPWVFMGYPTGWGEEKLGGAIQKYISGEITWEQLVTDTKASWKDARK
jgi:raffinose/stachyose/melibiose transport system substrate-binding protein